ncbi:aminoglycoside phosphotransferase family protein [Armatimonas rosea]|uniref:Streptomycin 6-kinase n=1 Tax=Armatimonas rosea TaxID=685828 RepID=A0A7W9W9S9_ARMRO|nr:aminoglycoside phosphotransferase family protein [Armatimonas rosea]MBB6053626.1 streptomycin 6-kinase [Armatimonas rosea]
MQRTLPTRLVATCQHNPAWIAWLDALPEVLSALEARWEVSLGEPFDGPNVSCSWVAPAMRADGSTAIFKLGIPAMEGRDELAGLRFWAGEPTVRILDGDDASGAFLMERCEPGTLLKTLPEPEQDVILTGMLQRLWRKPDASHPFRPLSEMLAFWGDETRADEARWPDPGLVRAGLALFEELTLPSADDVLLATDLHASNILAAQREPWLVIDPKPFVGDRTYDATQHLLHNCTERLRAHPDATIKRLAELADLDPARLQLWLFARAAAESRDDWSDLSLAQLLAP